MEEPVPTPKIVSARAYANNEVAYIAWDVDERIDGCLGFELTRLYVDTGDERPLAAWVPFKGQKNPSWEPSTTSVWPVQKFSWRDLTVRKRRDRTARRPSDVKVQYRVRAVGAPGRGRPPVQAPSDASYSGAPVSLAYLTDPIETNMVTVTSAHGDISASFTNGILAAQWLRHAMKTPDGKTPNKDDLLKAIKDAKSPIRAYLTGDVLDVLRSGIERASSDGGSAHLALYELADEELLDLLVDQKNRVHLILSNTSQDKSTKQWDAENQPARKALKGAATLQNRMFNNSGHIGHNKFTVVLGGDGDAEAVVTGSTNWTPTGLCGQTNNSLVIESKEVASAYLDYWNRLKGDALPAPKPLTAGTSNKQGSVLRASGKKPIEIDLDGGATSVEVWYSPNTTQSTKNANSPLPPDLAAVFAEMRRAHDAILFLAFLPSQEGAQSIIEEALAVAAEEPHLFVRGAVSDMRAMPNYKPKAKGDKNGKAVAPSVYTTKNVSVIRASALGGGDLVGEFESELLSAGIAIIHDKIVVIDPLSDDCVVVTGSHNLGYKASYCNDENLLIIKGNKSLAQAYAVHVMDVYDHYKFRAIQADRTKKAKGGNPDATLWSGFLSTDDRWQDDYLSRKKGAEARYFAGTNGKA